jgi:ABC-type multidrug transport system fused ATPase/permease subunit
MENLITHLETITTLILVIIMCIGLPWLTGILIDKILNIDKTDRDQVSRWFIGSIVILAILIFVLGIYCTYMGIFKYYTKH